MRPKLQQHLNAWCCAVQGARRQRRCRRHGGWCRGGWWRLMLTQLRCGGGFWLWRGRWSSAWGGDTRLVHGSSQAASIVACKAEEPPKRPLVPLKRCTSNVSRVQHADR